MNCNTARLMKGMRTDLSKISKAKMLCATDNFFRNIFVGLAAGTEALFGSKGGKLKSVGRLLTTLMWRT